MVTDTNAFQIIPDEASRAFFRNTLTGTGNFVPVESWQAIFWWTNAAALVTIPNQRSYACLWLAMAFAKIPVKIEASWTNRWHADASTFSLAPGKPILAILRLADTVADSAVEVVPSRADFWYADAVAFFIAPEGASRARNGFNAHALTDLTIPLEALLAILHQAFAFARMGVKPVSCRAELGLANTAA